MGCWVGTPPDTALPVIEAAFKDLTDRDDVGIVLINQHVSCASCRKYDDTISKTDVDINGPK
jgi:vacuolar-type H+-ATPase subunit F/Vma7